MILGRDWPKKNNVRLYFDLGLMRIDGKVYAELKEDLHISTIVRTPKKLIMRPNTVTVFYGKINNNFPLEKSDLVEVNSIDNNCIMEDPGLYLKDAVCIVRKDKKVPMIFVNQTNKNYKIPKGYIVGRITALKQKEISEIQTTQDTKEEIDVPKRFEHSIKRLVSKNNDLFAKKDSDLGVTDTGKMKIETGDHHPIKNRPYRVPLNKRQIIDKAILEMMDAKIIERSQSPWSFPLVVVKKKDGSDRMCVDFRSLNKIVKPVSFPLPLIDDILCLLGKAKYFTALDLKSGYCQVKLEDSSKEKTAFACHKGLFQFNRMPFGLSNAPAVFQELMNIVLQGQEEFAIAYLDDILIFSETPEDHLRHIQDVFNRLRKHGLKMKLKQCSFFKEQTEYLGFIIDEHGVTPDPKKVEAIRKLPAPTTVREVRGFIGMCSYYRRFIPNFSKIAEPLIDLTRKYARFKWTPCCQKAFDFIKESLTVVPLLAYPDTNKPYILYTDASDNCIGACLTQKTDEGEDKPIYYLSHKLSKTQEKWSTIEKEAFAIHYALQKLDHYLHGAQFTLRTDHKPLKYILESPMQNKKIQLWALSIAGYNCKVEYIEGRFNCCADLLSRLPTVNLECEEEEQSEHDEPDVKDNFFEVNVLNSNAFSPKRLARCEVKQHDELVKPFIDLPEEINIKDSQQHDEQIKKLKNRLNKGTATATEEKKFLEIDGLMYYLSDGDSDGPKLRLYVPRELELLVVQQYHDGLGHMGVDKTYDVIRQNPQGNGKVERFHRTLHDVMAKKTTDNAQTWDIHLNQTLAAICFHPNDSSKFSPYYLMYNRDVVLPLDTLMKLRRRDAGEDQHKIALQEQHKAFLLVHRNMKEAKKKQKAQADKKSKDENFQVGDPVYLKNNRRQNKLDKKWLPYYRIIEQKGPVSFVVRDQLTGLTTKCHARQLRLADISHWPLSQTTEDGGRTLRKTNYVVPLEDESSSENEDMQPERAIQSKQWEREGSSDEEDIPLAELQRRIRGKKIIDDQQYKHENDQTVDSESNETRESEQCDENSGQDYEIPLDNPNVPLDENMEIDEIVPKVGLGFKPILKPRCRKRGSDGDTKGSSKDTVFCCENPEKWTSSDIIELEPIPKVTRIQEKPRRSGRIATRKLTSNTGTISTKLAQQFLGEEENEDYPWTKYYRPDPELVRKYLEEKAAMSTQQRNAGDAPREVASPSAPTFYPRVPMMDE
ncbi:uncharacterized protein [Magallana gigas]|uniref:uncharacterized protein n=1 Tax=Magallana gigas TaxID=29159 RepID=UPI00333F9EE5